METLELIIGAVVLVGVLAAGLAVGLVRRGRSAAERTLRRSGGGDDRRDEGLRPGVGDDAEEPRDSATRTIDTLPPPDLLGVPDAVAVPTEPLLERPAPVAGRLVRLRERLARSNSALGRGLLALLSRDTIDEETWEEVEDTLLLADLGVGPAGELVDRLRSRVRTLGERDPQRVKGMLREELLAVVDPAMDRTLRVERPVEAPGHPAVVMVVGVNGTGKTTTVGKLARVLVAQDKDVVLGAADTFRAAAAEQLATWGERVGVPTVRSDREGADPAAVAFDAVRTGTELEADVVLVDTAGRLQNKAGLMDELGKVKRVIERSGPVSEVLLVLDATTGQNGLKQAAVFSQVVDVTGIVLTKLDGTAKGGIVVAVQRELGVPVKLVGLGEGPDDLAPFDPEAFVDAILG
ncbi:signal recognition particle-docking protein FtsY [Quadrisphaera sp. INWT6]|uniref:signal recognition particle-docking protein FtsY n=1 Tax=Quadrisphaera sp. INWT6 TaxID=2596917 RepID=UPI0018922B83|nr:signal recognition particle-docking protein FtsY [Quadrisphaera sp. INWT6]MBF5080657.1 signal recognition particle-docking protein FtsY [Quadrisphaera sp. INWT6]